MGESWFLFLLVVFLVFSADGEISDSETLVMTSILMALTLACGCGCGSDENDEKCNCTRET